MEEKSRQQSGDRGGLDRVLQAGGSAGTFAYDKTASILGSVVKLAKKSPKLPRRLAEVFRDGVASVKPGEVKWVEDKISQCEKKIKMLYFDIGREVVDSAGRGGPVETERVRDLIVAVRGFEEEIQSLRERIADIAAEKKAETLKRQQLRKDAVGALKRRDKAAETLATKGVEEALSRALICGRFDSAAQQKMFEKIAHDLLDSEAEIKILAAAALGKLGNAAAVPLLMEAVQFNNHDLTEEILTSLIKIGDPRAVPLFLEELSSPDKRVRTGCLRGLCELADDDLAVPALIRLLEDRSLDVREKALEALRKISDEDISFDMNASGPEMAEQINDLKVWWRLQCPDSGGFDFVEASAAATEAESPASSPVGGHTAGAEPALFEEVAREAEQAAEPVPEADVAEAATAETSGLTEESLMRMNKAELLLLCEKRSITCTEKQTKSEITDLILGNDAAGA